VVGGAALVVRQYFLEGMHVCGYRRAADSLRPASALLKAVLIGSARPLSGVQDTMRGGPAAWDAFSGSYRSISVASAGLPNEFQGFGRPELRQVRCSPCVAAGSP
jgi:hypothetical protein